MSLEQKIKMASALERLGVDRIEAGFPVSSPVQFEAVQRVSATVKKAEVVGLARCVQRDIDAAYDALRDAAHPMLHIFIATSPLHREYKLKKVRKRFLIRFGNASITVEKAFHGWNSALRMPAVPSLITWSRW